MKTIVNSVPKGGRQFHWLRLLFLGGSLSVVMAANAQQTSCTVFALPVLKGFGTPSPNGISEGVYDAAHGAHIYYLAGGFSVYPLVFNLASNR